MSDTGKAVFLSYASQDAEVAKRICEALRQTGVEVWFDQNELVGGDAWDAKIRKQIAECGLFVPLISANTQARREGYFRIEWRLAAQRTHAMSDDTAFLLPVVIDDTRDAEAKVPAEFKAVQWTRLPGGEAPEKFCARVKQLLGGEVASASSRPAVGALLDDDRGLRSAEPRQKLSRIWMVQATLVATVIVVVAIKQPWRPAVSAIPPAVTTTAQPLSEARKLERQARALIDDDPLRVRENYRTACELCERATTLSPDDADAWATYARASCVLFADYNERGDKAIAAARLRAERAIRLAPDSLEANLAKAQYAIQVGGDGVTGERQLRALLERAPNDRRILRALARTAGELVDRQPEKLAESRQWAERAEALPGGDTLALTELGWGYWGLNLFPELNVLLDRILGRQPTSDAYHLKVMVLAASADMDGVLSWLEKIPPAVLSEDRVASVAIDAYLAKRQPDKALALLARLPREFLEEGRYFSPKSYLAGRALSMAGKTRAAEIEFRSALKTIEDRIAAKPNDARLFRWKGRILALLGDLAGAAREFETGRELSSSPSSTIAAADLVLLGRYDEAIAAIDGTLNRDQSRWPSFFSQLKFNQDFDPLRQDARFVALIARGDGWLREMRSPAATSAGAATIAPAVDDKSVAVLAFADLSAAHDSEYFSDGISEELLNVLAKVPGLKVTARTSAFSFKGKNVPMPEIGRQLGVAYVVEGSVRKAGDRVRITAQLIKAADGFHVWSDNFDRDLKDIFAVQDEIAGLIAKKLSLKLGTSSPTATAVVNPEAFRLYLEGRQEISLRNHQDWLARAEKLFTQAVAIDPKFARAHAGLADVWMFRAENLSRGGAELAASAKEYGLADEFLARAMALDPDLAEAYSTRGNLLVSKGQYAEAERTLQRALQLNPNYAPAHRWYGRYLFSWVSMDAGIAELARSRQLDPLTPVNASNHGMYLGIARRWPECLAASEQALALQPDFTQALSYRVRALLRLGRRTEALTMLQAEVDAFKASGEFFSNSSSTTNMIIATVQAGDLANAELLAKKLLRTADGQAGTGTYEYLLALDRIDEAFAYLERGDFRGLTPADGAIAFLDPVYDRVRDDPRFLRKVQAHGLLAPYQNLWAQYLAWKKQTGQP